MKARTMLQRTITALALFLLPGCNDYYTITTIVSTDGSADRVIEWGKNTSRESDYSVGQLPLPIDSSWRISLRRTGAADSSLSKDSNLVFTASKHFASFEALTAEYTRAHDSTKLQIVVGVQKRFRWFYTYFAYAETYKAFHPLTMVPAGEFFAPGEIAQFMANNVSDSLRTRFKAWEERNAFEFVYRRLVSAATALNDPDLPATAITANKEALSRAFLSDNTTQRGEKKSGNDTLGVEGSMAVLESVLHTSAVAQLRQPLAEAIEEWMKDYEERSVIAGTYTNAVVMPGIILNTNAQNVDGNRVKWTFSDDQLSMMDVSMEVESRVVNVWAIVVTGAVVLGLLGVPIVVQLRRLPKRQ